MKPRWVLDTNVLISAALTRGGTCDLLFQSLADGQFAAAWDYPLLAGYREVLARPRFRFSRPVQAEIIALFDFAWHTPAASHAPPSPIRTTNPFSPSPSPRPTACSSPAISGTSRPPAAPVSLCSPRAKPSPASPKKSWPSRGDLAVVSECLLS